MGKKKNEIKKVDRKKQNEKILKNKTKKIKIIKVDRKKNEKILKNKKNKIEIIKVDGKKNETILKNTKMEKRK